MKTYARLLDLYMRRKTSVQIALKRYEEMQKHANLHEAPIFEMEQEVFWEEKLHTFTARTHHAFLQVCAPLS